MHAYWRSDWSMMSQSWPLAGSAMNPAPGPGTPARGATDSYMRGSIVPSSTGYSGRTPSPAEAPNNRSQSSISSAVSALALRYFNTGAAGSTARSCQGTPTMPPKNTRLLGRTIPSRLNTGFGTTEPLQPVGDKFSLLGQI